jgi:hypothetical protein
MIMSEEHGPTTSFRPFFNPATGETITYTAIAEDTHLGPEPDPPPLWALAKVFGVRPYYHRWDSRIRAAGQGASRRL